MAKNYVIAFLVFLPWIFDTVAAQTLQPQRNVIVDAAQRKAVIEEVIRQLNESYHSRETAEQMEKAIREHLKNKKYEQISSAAALAEILTVHLQQISRDKHLRVFFSPDSRPPVNSSEQTPQEREKEREKAKLNAAFSNYGLPRVERMAWNVGYIDFRGFFPADIAGEAVTTAMGFVGETSALVIDLRNNSGGEADMVAWLTGYFFDEPVLVGSVYMRKDDRLRQFWTSPYVPGKRYLGKDVYILTSKDTISAAEAFAYNLQVLRRATIIGEITAGAANPGSIQQINEHFSIWMPKGRVIHPLTKTNWEGTGVKPDIEVSSELALKTAHIAALQKFIEKTTDDDRLRGLRKTVTTLQTEIEEMKKKK